MIDPDDTREVERLLAGSRPRPSSQFVTRTEHRLFRSGPTPGHGASFKLAFASLAAATAIIAIAMILALAGTGPFASDDDAARAQPDCRWVNVSKPGRIPVVKETESGPRIVYRNGTVRTRERVCR